MADFIFGSIADSTWYFVLLRWFAFNFFFIYLPYRFFMVMLIVYHHDMKEITEKDNREVFWIHDKKEKFYEEIKREKGWDLGLVLIGPFLVGLVVSVYACFKAGQFVFNFSDIFDNHSVKLSRKILSKKMFWNKLKS